MNSQQLPARASRRTFVQGSGAAASGLLFGVLFVAGFARWYAVLSSVAAAVLMFTLSNARVLVLIRPLWLAATSLVILFRRASDHLEVA